MDRFPFQDFPFPLSPRSIELTNQNASVGFAFSLCVESGCRRLKGRLEERDEIAIMVNTFAHFPRFQWREKRGVVLCEIELFYKLILEFRIPLRFRTTLS